MERPTEEIIVAFSCGKDSLALLDVCVREFRRVVPFFMYWVKGMSFQEATLTAAERRYGIKIERIPHFDLPEILSDADLADHHPDRPDFRSLDMRTMHDLWRRRTGLHWIATGEKKNDSFTRRFMLKAVGGAWDVKRGVYCPLLDWTNTQVFAYLKMRHIALPAEYTYMKRSWGGFEGKDLKALKQYFPADYRKILEIFPHAEALVKSYELYREGKLPRKKRVRKQTPELHPASSKPGESGSGPVESPPD